MVKIEGLKELNRAIEKLSKAVGADAVEPIIKGAADIITAKVQENVNAIPAVTGNLRKSPVTKMMPNRYGDQPRPSIAAIDRKVAPHAHLLERGTSKMSPRPFFRPAWDAGKGPALQHIKEGLKKAVESGVR